MWTRAPGQLSVTIFAAALLTIPLLVAACGGTAPAPSAGTRTPVATTSVGSGSGAGGVMNPSRLASLTDYSFIFTDGTGSAKLTESGEIHSPEDFMVTAFGSAKTFFVNGQAYEVLGSLAPQKITLNPGYYQTLGETAAAATFADLTKASGVKVIAGGGCTVAGISGTVYQEETPGNGGLLSIAQEGCVANRGGALLSFQEGVSGSVAPGGGGESYTFTVTSVGTVGPISVP